MSKHNTKRIELCKSIRNDISSYINLIREIDERYSAWPLKWTRRKIRSLKKRYSKGYISYREQVCPAACRFSFYRYWNERNFYPDSELYWCDQYEY